MKNLVIANMPEPVDPGTNKWYTEHKKAADTKFFIGMVRESLDLNISETDIQDIIRLGSIKPGSKYPNRLTLVTFTNINKKREVLGKSKLLHSSKYKNIYINPDLTPEQRKEDAKIRNELFERRSRGEKDLVIAKGRIIKSTEKIRPSSPEKSLNATHAKNTSKDGGYSESTDNTTPSSNVDVENISNCSDSECNDTDSSATIVYSEVSDISSEEEEENLEKDKQPEKQGPSQLGEKRTGKQQTDCLEVVDVVVSESVSESVSENVSESVKEVIDVTEEDVDKMSNDPNIETVVSEAGNEQTTEIADTTEKDGNDMEIESEHMAHLINMDNKVSETVEEQPSELVTEALSISQDNEECVNTTEKQCTTNSDEPCKKRKQQKPAPTKSIIATRSTQSSL